MKLKAFAKLNLFLNVFEKRPDGYHNLESLMQSISLADIITLTPIASGIEVTCNKHDVPLGPANLVYKAAELFFRKQNVDGRLRPEGLQSEGTENVGVKIHIEKNIPMAAGLAGGSADAAAVLYGLNEMSNEGITILGAQIGSDIPFCLTGGTCLVEGRGEIVTRQEPWPHSSFILVTPNLHVSTKWAYDEFDRMKNEKLKMKNESKNYLEAVVARKYPEILKLKERLIKLGCSESQMSGSGPSVFGLINDPERATAIVNELRLDYPQSFVVETVQRGVTIIEP